MDTMDRMDIEQDGNDGQDGHDGHRGQHGFELTTMNRAKRGLFCVALIVAGLLLSSEPALAQCAMCRATLTGANSTFIRNLNLGILVLLVPPVSIFCSIFIVAIRRHKNR